MPKVSDLFDVQYGHSLELNRLKRANRGEGVAFVSRQMGDNGISAWVEHVSGVDPAPPGELTCALGGNGVLTTHLQEQPYYTAFHVARLIPLVSLTKTQLIYYALCIKANRYRYSYGRQANRSLKELEVPPINAIPPYVASTDLDQFTGRDAPLSDDPLPRLDTTSWRPFTLGKLFSIKKGKRLTKANIKPGHTPFISALDSNNGLRQRIAEKPRHPAGVITVNYNGNGVAESFFQPEPFWASDDVNVLYPRANMSDAMSLFVCAVIRFEKYRFSYGRKWNLSRMRQSVISLPASAAGEPDWDFMGTYMSCLPFSSTLRNAANQFGR
ncbi:MAG: restriction endonuclease subunit S [Roseiarcus sp.]|jgi:hypothetical protein